MTDADFIAWLKSRRAIRTVLVEIAAVGIAGVPTTLYLSNRGYVSGAGQTPANTAYQAVVSGGLSVGDALGLQGPTGSVGGGDIEIANPAGVRDAWLSYVFANRQVRVYMGDPRWPRGEFRLMFDGVAGDIGSSSADTLNISLLDKLDRLNNPISETVLGGSTPEKDRLIPLVFGEVHNMEPLLVDAANLEYQVHGGAIEDVIEVRDNGAPRTITKTLGTGKFRLTAARVGQITASVQGDKPAGAYTFNISVLVQRIATAYGPANSRFSSGDLDAANLGTFAASNTQPVGYVANGQVNQLEAMQQLAGSLGAQVVCTSLGLLRLVKVALPAVGTPVAVTERDLYEKSIRIGQRGEVIAAYKLGYCKNWTLQSSGLASGLPDSSQSLFAQEWLTVTATDAAVATAYKLTTEPAQVNTLLLKESDATTEATRRLSLWKVPRHVYQADYGPHMLLTELGDAITLNHARFELGAGKTGIVVSIQRDLLAGRITIGVLA